jgi:pyruvate/2-oxoglutarate dehydrogenase complex dihydrolipoamide dehydrogenase (E3) component
MIEHFDAIVIGSGQAGPSLAARLAAAGNSVAIIEREHFGGTCVNTGCTPTKTLVASAYVAHMARRAGDYGVTAGGNVGVDIKQVMARKDAIVEKSRTGVQAWMESTKGITVIQGHARFTEPRTVSVDSRELTASKIFINTGGRPLISALKGVDQVPCLTSNTILNLKDLPEHLVVVGGSYIGLEFAQIFRRFGSKVTVVEMAEKLIAREDPDISDAVKSILEEEGIEVRLNAKCLALERHGQRTEMTLGCSEGAPSVSASHVLLAVGRRPNTDDIGLDKAGIATDAKGYIIVDDQCQTNVDGVWAIGDVNGRGAFTHTSYNDYEIVAANILDEGNRRISDRIPCYGLFIDPPLGRAGMTDTEVKAKGIVALTAKRMMTSIGRARERSETQGFMKITVDANSKHILGAALLGINGDEAVHTVLDVMAAQAPYTAISHTVHIHPTVSEYLPTLLGELKPLQ